LAAFDPDFFKVLVRYNLPTRPLTDSTDRAARGGIGVGAKAAGRALRTARSPNQEQLAQNEDQFTSIATPDRN